MTRRPRPREGSYEGDGQEQTDGFGGAVDGTWMISTTMRATVILKGAVA